MVLMFHMKLSAGDGDMETFADASKAEQEMGWKAELKIEDMVRDAWRFEQKHSITQFF